MFEGFGDIGNVLWPICYNSIRWLEFQYMGIKSASSIVFTCISIIDVCIIALDASNVLIHAMIHDHVVNLSNQLVDFCCKLWHCISFNIQIKNNVIGFQLLFGQVLSFYLVWP